MTDKDKKIIAGHLNTMFAARWTGIPDTTIAAELAKGRHWLMETPSIRPTIASFLKMMLRTFKWSQAQLSREVGMHVCNLSRLITGTQQSCSPITKAKFVRLAAGTPYLETMCAATDWGFSAEPNRTAALEKKRRTQ